jgi:hypothetical protein
VVVINGPHDHQFVISPDALSAQDAFAEIPDQKRVGLFQGFVMGHGIKTGFTDAQGSGNVPQFTAVPLAAEDARFRVFGEHQADDVPSVGENPGRCGQHGQSFCHRGHAGSHEPACFFIFDKTQPTSPIGFE